MPIPHVPTTADELVAALEEGVLVESLHFDAKELLAEGAKSNRALAIDLAAMSVEGGLIAIGVAQGPKEQGSRLIPRPVALGGLAERVSQIGLGRVDPPLTISTRLLETGDAAMGYLLVLIPPSPDAPHMVDGRYRGRGDTTNYPLGDAEVRRIQAQRRAVRVDIGTELQRAIDNDPTPPDLRREAHLFVVARPMVPTRPTMLQERLGAKWQPWMHANILSQPRPMSGSGSFGPDVHNLVNVFRRPAGWAAASTAFTGAREISTEGSHREGGLLEVEVDEDGAIRLFCGRGSDWNADSPLNRWTFEPLLVGLTWRVLLLAATIAAETDYVGNWDVGVALTNARGIASYNLEHGVGWGHRSMSFGADEYRAVTEATYAEVSENRHAILQRLLGRLNRALNDDVIPLHNFDAAE